MSDEVIAGPRKLAFALPAIFTVLNLFLGYWAIAKSVKGEVGEAAFLVLLSAVLDKLDGLVARKTGTESEFGRELDSLADVVSFGVAPALVAFAFGLNQLGRIGWNVTFLFLLCGSLRLARFNVQAAVTDHRFFKGLPIPMAAAVPMTLVFAYWQENPDHPLLEKGPLTWWFLALMVIVAALMVSSIRYLSFKDISVGRQRWQVPLVVGGILAAVASAPSVMLPVLALTYASHGPIMAAWRALGLPSPKARLPRDHPA